MDVSNYPLIKGEISLIIKSLNSIIIRRNQIKNLNKPPEQLIQDLEDILNQSFKEVKHNLVTLINATLLSKLALNNPTPPSKITDPSASASNLSSSSGYKTTSSSSLSNLSSVKSTHTPSRNDLSDFEDVVKEFSGRVEALLSRIYLEIKQLKKDRSDINKVINIFNQFCDKLESVLLPSTTKLEEKPLETIKQCFELFSELLTNYELLLNNSSISQYVNLHLRNINNFSEYRRTLVRIQVYN